MFLFQRRSGKDKTGLYMRLSVEDNDKLESDSIKNQRELLRAYAESHPELEVVDEYVDDGYTGTNFDRPAFSRIMQDCEAGRINCIVVKDLSRLGRNFIGMGKLMERVFPQKGIRLIAINDNYDNAKENSAADDVVVPFKNLLNDSYSRDISTKIRSQLSLKCRRGEFIGNYAPYGYQKDERNHNHLVVDDYAASVVRDIFQWRMDGMSAQRIADKLNHTGVLSPSEYKRLAAGTYRSGFRSGEKAKWQATQIIRILTNEIYLGTMVQGKRQKVNDKVKKIRDVAPENWIRVRETHEAIITQQLFDTVQEVIKLDTCAGEGQETVHLFSGIVECGSCHQSMVRRMTSKNGKRYFYLHCSTYKNHGGCTSHIISESKLYDVVLKALQQEIAAISKIEDRLHEIDQIPRDQRKIKSFHNQIAMLEKEIEKYTELRRQLYEDMTSGIVDKEEYLEFNRTFTQKIEAAQTSQMEARRQMELLLNIEVSQLPWIEMFKKYMNLQELNRRVLVELVEKIIVIDKTQIVIRFRFQEQIDSVLAYCDECEGDADEDNVVLADEMTEEVASQ